MEFVSGLDRELFLVLNSWHAAWLNPVMIFLSSQLIWIPLIFLIFVLAWKQLEQKSFFIFLLFLIFAVMASDVTSSYLLKNIVQRMRPCRVADIKELMNHFGQKCGGRFGFVSSHAANSLVILVFSFLSLKFKSPKFSWLWPLPLMVGFSRVYLGVHYPGDVLGGYLVGAFWGIVFAKFFKDHESWGKSA